MRMPFVGGVVCALTAAGTARGSIPSAGFTGIGVLPGHVESRPLGLSRDGTTVVGFSMLNFGNIRGVTWRAGAGLQNLAVPVGLESPAVPRGANADGTVLVGSGQFQTNYVKAARWSPAGAEAIADPHPLPQSSAWSTSADGVFATGNRNGTAFRHEHGVGYSDLGALPGDTHSRGMGMSGDGSVIVGESGTSNAFRWTEAEGMEALPVGSATFARAYAVSGDGSVAVGNAGNRAARWVGMSGPTMLGFVGGDFSEAYGVNGDGSAVVGTGQLASGASAAFLWTPSLGTVNLNTYLAGVGFNLAGWTLVEARGISGDGLTITGWGSHQIGAGSRMEGWVVTLPSPAAGVWVGAGIMLAARRRR